MKIPAPLLGLLGLSLAISPLFATGLGGDSLNVGSNNDITNNANGGVFGTANYNDLSSNSVSIGDSNYIMHYSNSLVVGSYNSLYYLTSSLVLGDSNVVDVSLDNSLILGSENSIPQFLGSSLVSGYCHTVTGSFSAVAGMNNAITGNLQFAFGQGLISDNYWTWWPEGTPAVFLGQYNRFDTTLLLTVGNGPDATHRTNAFEVYQDGTVKIPKRQGDIVMGEFGNGNGD